MNEFGNSINALEKAYHHAFFVGMELQWHSSAGSTYSREIDWRYSKTGAGADQVLRIMTLMVFVEIKDSI